MWRRRLTAALIFATLLIQATDGAGGTPDYILVDVQEDGVTLGLVGAISEGTLWHSNWKSWERQAYEHGCWKVHTYMKPNPFSEDSTECEWLLVHIAVPDSVEIVLDYETKIVVGLADGRKVSSTEIVLTSDPVEREIYSTADQKIVLDGMRSEMYGRTSSGPYVVFVAFPRGALNLNHDRMPHAKFRVAPVHLTLERRVDP